MSFHAIVCIKSVVRAAPNGVGRRTPDNSELNPFDRPALEAALQLRDKMDGSVTVLSMGPAVGAEALAEAQAMGADRAVLISDPVLGGSDTLVTSRVLAAAVARLAPYDLIFFGTRTSDSDTGQVGAQTAAVARLPFVGGVMQITPNGQQWDMVRLMDDWQEQWQVQTPAAVTIHPVAFQPRSIPLGGIARAHDQYDVIRWDIEDLALSAEAVGLIGSPTRVSNLTEIKRKRTCRMLEGEPAEQVEALIDYLTTKGKLS